MPKLSSYSLPTLLSIGLHVLLVLCFLVQIASQSYRSPNSGPKQEVIKAVMISPTQLKPVKKIEPAPTPTPPEPQKMVKPPEEEKPVTKPEVPPAKPTPTVDMNALEEKLRKEQLVKEQRSLEKQRQQAKAKALEQQQQQQLLKKEQRELRKQKLLQQQKELQQKLLAQEMSKESSALDKAHQQMQAEQTEGIIDEYKAQIVQAIEQQWVIPSDADKNLSCQFVVRIASGGNVLSVTLVKSSGNQALDQSAEAAIYKASPLPVPDDPAIFENFRELRLKVSPKKRLEDQNN